MHILFTIIDNFIIFFRLGDVCMQLNNFLSLGSLDIVLFSIIIVIVDPQSMKDLLFAIVFLPKLIQLLFVFTYGCE